ncbi:MAG: ABC transporter permease [Candidatus Korarchaeota archaeon]|nr:ABC transporter permease [Thermoproteota archaeon]
MFTFNLGEDLFLHSGRPIVEILAARIPVSVYLILPETLIAIGIGIAIGARLGARPGGRFDVIMMAVALMLYSIPTFWLQLIFKLLFTVNWTIWPAAGGLFYYGKSTSDILINALDMFFMLILPIMTLVIAGFAGWMLLMRNSLMEVMGEDYILTAKAKGLDEATILYKHAFRNAILPVVTGVILALAFVWTGAVITETIFVIPGVGYLLFQAIIQLDYPLVEATFYFIALATIFANIIADISYALLDPRVRY